MHQSVVLVATPGNVREPYEYCNFVSRRQNTHSGVPSTVCCSHEDCRADRVRARHSRLGGQPKNTYLRTALSLRQRALRPHAMRASPRVSSGPRARDWFESSAIHCRAADVTLSDGRYRRGRTLAAGAHRDPGRDQVPAAPFSPVAGAVPQDPVPDLHNGATVRSATVLDIAHPRWARHPAPAAPVPLGVPLTQGRSVDVQRDARDGPRVLVIA
jgi:hypothetical protein